MHQATLIAADGITILEVAGNKSAILLSIIVPHDYYPDNEGTRTIFEQSLTTTTGKKRIVLVTPVKNLSTLLNTCKADKIKVEHVYDF